MEHTHGGVGRRLVHKLGDYVGHWSVTGVVTICLGKTPESLVEALLERLPDGAAKMLVAVPYPSTILVGIGVTIVTIDLVRHRRRRDPPTLVAPPSPTPFVPPPPPVTVHVHLDGTAANRAIAAAAAALPAIAHHDSDKPIALPFPSIGADFIGRDAFLRDLHASLHHGAATRAAISSGAISGMGGIGKTCAAVEYAWAHRDDYAALLFASAASANALDTNLAALVHPLALPEAASTDATQQKDAVLRWLNQHANWLLILDNIDTQDALRAVQALLGAVAGGHVLLTGRLARFGAGIATLELDLLDPDAATTMLLERTPHRRKTAADPASARDLAVHDLDRLPLALEHAVALIEHLRCTFTDYQARLRATPQALLDRTDLPLTHYDRTVFRTWHASVALLAPPARALLERLAFLAPDPVPESLLDVPLPDAPAEDLREALAGIAAWSLAQRQAEPPRFVVHRLVQEVTRLSLDSATLRQCLTEALGWMNAAFTGDAGDVRTWPHLDPLAPHAEAVVAFADAAGIAEPTLDLMSRLNALFDAKALHRRAETYSRRALAIAEASLGKDHPNVATALNNLAVLLQATNRLGEAEPLMRRALAITEASLGKDHPDVAIRLNNLAELLRATNRLGEAEPLMRRALAIDEASHGKDHPNVAIRLSNLAQLLRDTNRLGEAEPLMRRALAIDEARYDKDHPKVAAALNNLGTMVEAMGHIDEAEAMYRRALGIDEASYGKDHPNIATRLNNLALLLQDTNRLGEAEPLMHRALAIGEANYGKDHPIVAIRLNNLATLLEATNRLGEAEPLMRRALAIFLAFQRDTGHAHPHRDVAIGNYAGLLAAMGRGEADIAAAIATLYRDAGRDQN